MCEHIQTDGLVLQHEYAVVKVTEFHMAPLKLYPLFDIITKVSSAEVVYDAKSDEGGLSAEIVGSCGAGYKYRGEPTSATCEAEASVRQVADP